jgi:hypothetical protein
LATQALVAGEMMTADDTEVLEHKSLISTSAGALGIQKDVATQQVFDFRLVREVYKELRETDLDRALKPGR